MEKKENIKGREVTVNSGALLPQKASFSLHNPDLSLAMKTFKCHLGQPLVEGHSILSIYFSILKMNSAFLWDICNPTSSLPSKPGGIRKLRVHCRWGHCSDCPSPWSGGIFRKKCLSYSVSLLLPPSPSPKEGICPSTITLGFSDSRKWRGALRHRKLALPALVDLPTASARASSHSRDAQFLQRTTQLLFGDL